MHKTGCLRSPSAATTNVPFSCFPDRTPIFQKLLLVISCFVRCSTPEFDSSQAHNAYDPIKAKY